MRKRFFELLYDIMLKTPNMIALTGDLGYGGFDRIRKEIPERFMNCGASEQAMLDIAVGLTYKGAIPVCYSITPFLIYRPFESLRTYVNHEEIPVKLIASGRGKDYEHDGFSHHASDDSTYLELMPNIELHYPSSILELEKNLNDWLTNRKPTYINLTRKV